MINYIPVLWFERRSSWRSDQYCQFHKYRWGLLLYIHFSWLFVQEIQYGIALTSRCVKNRAIVPTVVFLRIIIHYLTLSSSSPGSFDIINMAPQYLCLIKENVFNIIVVVPKIISLKMMPLNIKLGELTNSRYVVILHVDM